MILSTLREKAGHIIIIVIGLSIVAFLLSDAIRTGGSLWSGSGDEVANVGGEKIAYSDFNQEVQRNISQFMAQSGQTSASPQITAYALQQVWRRNLERIIYGKELEQSGLATGAEELAQLLTGDNPHPIARQAFSGPEGYSSEQALEIYRNRSSFSAEQQNQLLELENQVRQANSIEKYIDLVSAGVYMTSLELKANNDKTGKTASADYIKLAYSSIPDSAVSVSDAELEAYYRDNSYKYKQEEELRSFEYVSFEVVPSKEDSVQAQKDINQLAEEFRNTSNDSLFYFSNATTRDPLVYTKKQRLPENLADSLFDAPLGTVYGPYFEGNAYKVAKLLDAAVIPDSVEVRHILVSTQTTPNREERHQTLDSLRQLITTAERSFGELAREFSDDQGSAERGGEYGYVGYGRMTPEFNQAMFFGKEGELQIVDTQYGTHLLEVTGRKNVSRSVKIAVVDQPFEPGQESYRREYSKAGAFLSGVSESGFNEQVKEAGAVKRVAENVRAVDFSVPGLPNPRDVVQWAFDAELGEVSELFDLNDRYVVARLTEIKPEGVSSLDLVRNEVETEVRQQKKGEQLSGKLKEMISGETASLSDAATKLGDSVRTVDNITQRNPMIPGAGYEPQLVGSIFGSGEGETGGPVTGMTGVYAYTVKGFTEPEPVTDPVQAKTTVGNRLRQQYMPFLFEALQDKTKIEDNRAKFY